MAASAGAIRAGRAFVELFAEDSKLVRGLKGAERSFQAFGKSVQAAGLKIAAVGTSMVTPFLGAAKLFASTGSALFDMSQRTGLSVEQLSALQFAAEQSGASMADLEVGVKKMQRTIVDAAKGEKGATEALKLLGLEAKDLTGLDTAGQINLLADALQNVKDPAVATAAAVELFGRGGTKLLPMLKGGAAGMAEFTAQAEAMGLIMSGPEAAAADQLGDAMDAAFSVIKRIIAVIGSTIAPILTDIASRFAMAGKAITEFIQQNEEIFQTVFKVAAGIAAFGAAIVAVGLVISGLGTIFGVIGTAATVFGGIITGIGAAIGFLMSPIGLVIGGLTALGAAFFAFTDSGQAALESFGEAFTGMKDTALLAFGGIKDALAAGDIELAMKVLWLGLKALWAQGVAFLKETWFNLRDSIVDVWAGAQQKVSSLAIDAWNGLKIIWVEFVAGLKVAWAGFVNYIAGMFDEVAGFLEKRMNDIRRLDPFSDFDADAANEAVDAATAASKKARDQRTQDDIKAARKAADAATMRIGGDVLNAQSDLQKQFAADKAARDAANAAALAALNADVAAAKAELTAATDKAKAAAAAAEPIEVPDKKKAGPEIPDELDKLAKAAKVTAAGTFSAQTTGLGIAGRIPEQQLAVQKQMNQKLDKVAKNTEDLQAEFA